MKTTKDQLAQIRVFVNKNKPKNQHRETFRSYIKPMGTELYWEEKNSLNEEQKQSNIRNLWSDLFRGAMLNNKSLAVFKSWLDWLANMKDERAHYLSIQDQLARKFIKEKSLELNEHYTELFPFNIVNLANSVTSPNKLKQPREELQIDLFNLFLQRIFSSKNYDQLVSQFKQGIGVMSDELWGAWRCGLHSLGGSADHDGLKTQIYEYHNTLYGRGYPFSYQYSLTLSSSSSSNLSDILPEDSAFSKSDSKESQTPVEGGKVQIAPSGLLQLTAKGRKIIEIGGTWSVTAHLISDSKVPLSFSGFKQTVESEQKELEDEFKGITNKSIANEGKFPSCAWLRSIANKMIAKPTLEDNYKEFLVKASTNSVISETFNDIRLIIKSVDDIKKIPNLSLRSYNEALIEMREFLKNPETSDAKKIQDNVSHLFRLLMLHKQRALAEKAIEKFKDLKADHPLQKKFCDINFLYLDRMTNSNHGKYFDLLGIMNDLDKYLDNFSLDGIDSKQSDSPEPRLIEGDDFSEVTLAPEEIYFKISDFADSEAKVKELGIEYTLINKEGKKITDTITQQELKLDPSGDRQTLQTRILKIISIRKQISTTPEEDLVNEFDKTIEKLSIIDQQIAKNSQMKNYKFLRNIVDDCFANYREQLKISLETSTSQSRAFYCKEITDLDSSWNEIRSFFANTQPQAYIQAVFSLIKNEQQPANLRYTLINALVDNYPGFTEQFCVYESNQALTKNQCSFFKQKPHHSHKTASIYKFNLICNII